MRRGQRASRDLSRLLRRLFAELQRTEPVRGEYDVVWDGPWFVRRARRWLPSRFLLYGGQLFGWLGNGLDRSQLTWTMATDEVAIESDRSWSAAPIDEDVWRLALASIVKKLARARRNPDAYHRFVGRRLPPACREGVVQRRLTWEKGRLTAMPARFLARLEKELGVAAKRPLLPSMTLARYLRTCAIAYDAAFPDLRRLTALAKRQRRADTRHGGLLDLPRHDAEAFTAWFESPQWRGTHPWEIVFGHPHGILLQPYRPEGQPGWCYWMSVDSLGLYIAAAKMAMALCRAKAPLRLLHDREVLAALRGEDDVRVGPDIYDVHWEDLARERKDALRHIRWDPIPRIEPISDEQRVRVAYVLRTGRPPLADAGEKDEQTEPR